MKHAGIKWLGLLAVCAVMLDEKIRGKKERERERERENDTNDTNHFVPQTVNQ